MITNIFVQARMSSERFPGKILAPFNGQPLIKSLLDNMQKIVNKNKVIVLTSTEISDDPLVAYLTQIGYQSFRGSLDNVFDRFQKCLLENQCDYFVRLSADSPLMSKELVSEIISQLKSHDYDFVSNVFKRKFPRGQSVEIAKSKTFLGINSETLSAHEREHVMPYFYSNKGNYKTLVIDSVDDLGEVNFCVDTLEDLRELQKTPKNYHFDKSRICLATE
jgi:spore coat polysaccharide biosynthesis protein SpsF